MSDSMVPETYRGLRSFAFGDSPDLADELLDLVLKGVKTATCSTEDEPNTSTPGERWVVLDGRGDPRCVIESTEVTYRRYGDVDAAFAHDEGEGDRSLAYWRAAHRAYFGRLGKFSEDMMLMCERFRLVEIFADRTLSVPSPLDQEEGSASALAHDGLKYDDNHCGRARSAPSPVCGGGLGWGCLRSGDRDG